VVDTEKDKGGGPTGTHGGKVKTPHLEVIGHHNPNKKKPRNKKKGKFPGGHTTKKRRRSNKKLEGYQNNTQPKTC